VSVPVVTLALLFYLRSNLVLYVEEKQLLSFCCLHVALFEDANLVVSF